MGDFAVAFVPVFKISTSIPLFSVITPFSKAFSDKYFAPVDHEGRALSVMVQKIDMAAKFQQFGFSKKLQTFLPVRFWYDV